MTVINRSALLPYSSQQMFELVNDIAAYPQYMEGCVGADILRRDAELIEARLHLSRGGIRQSFTTRNRLRPHDSIHMELLEGPFSEFGGHWQFQALQTNACKVILDLHFTVANRVVGLAAGKLFDSVAGNLVNALTKRARHVYGGR